MLICFSVMLRRTLPPSDGSALMPQRFFSAKREHCSHYRGSIRTKLAVKATVVQYKGGVCGVYGVLWVSNCTIQHVPRKRAVWTMLDFSTTFVNACLTWKKAVEVRSAVEFLPLQWCSPLFAHCCAHSSIPTEIGLCPRPVLPSISIRWKLFYVPYVEQKTITAYCRIIEGS